MTKILAVDVHYGDQVAVVAGVLFSAWSAEQPDEEITQTVTIDSDYIPSQFYLRELPCIQALLDVIALPLDLIIVDGYVCLGADQRPGLGWHLWQRLDQKVPVVGVAKSKFRGTPESTHLLRGGSQSPLYVTTAGMDLQIAKDSVASMDGPYRIPTLLKRVDQLCRAGLNLIQN